LDHTEFTVLALQFYDVYRESILGFASQNALGGEHIALVTPTLVSPGFSVLPGFAPAGELLLGASRRAHPLFGSSRKAKPLCGGKGHKTIDAPVRPHGLGGRRPWMRAGQLAALKQGQPVHESVHTWGRAAGVG